MTPEPRMFTPQHIHALRMAARRPDVRASKGWLSDSEILLIVEQLKNPRQTFDEIAKDWLVGFRTIQRIAKRHGLSRLPRGLMREAA